MGRPTRPPHDGVTTNKTNFQKARQNLLMLGQQSFVTLAGTPFTAEAHIDSKGSHKGHESIVIKRDGKIRAYVYACCWGHTTNCKRTYIDSYTPLL